MKTLLFVGVLLIVLVVVSGNVQEGLLVNTNLRMRDLLIDMNNLYKLKPEYIDQSDLLSSKFKELDPAYKDRFLARIPNAKIMHLKNNDFFTVDVKLGLTNIINNHSTKDALSKRITDYTTMTTAKTQMDNIVM